MSAAPVGPIIRELLGSGDSNEPCMTRHPARPDFAVPAREDTHATDP